MTPTPHTYTCPGADDGSADDTPGADDGSAEDGRGVTAGGTVTAGGAPVTAGGFTGGSSRSRKAQGAGRIVRGGRPVLALLYCVFGIRALDNLCPAGGENHNSDNFGWRSGGG